MVPLHFAVHQDHTDIARLLIEGGAQLDIATKVHFWHFRAPDPGTLDIILLLKLCTAEGTRHGSIKLHNIVKNLFIALFELLQSCFLHNS